MTLTGTIILSRGRDSWLATIDDERVTSLLGTNTIPLPFESSFPANRVLAEMREMQPRATVCLSGYCLSDTIDRLREIQ